MVHLFDDGEDAGYVRISEETSRGGNRVHEVPIIVDEGRFYGVDGHEQLQKDADGLAARLSSRVNAARIAVGGAMAASGVNDAMAGVLADAEGASDLASFRGAVLRRLERIVGADTSSALPAPAYLGGNDDPPTRARR